MNGNFLSDKAWVIMEKRSIFCLWRYHLQPVVMDMMHTQRGQCCSTAVKTLMRWLTLLEQILLCVFFIVFYVVEAHLQNFFHFGQLLVCLQVLVYCHSAVSLDCMEASTVSIPVSAGENSLLCVCLLLWWCTKARQTHTHTHTMFDFGMSHTFSLTYCKDKYSSCSTLL